MELRIGDAQLTVGTIGVLDLSQLSPHHFQVLGKKGVETEEFDYLISVTKQRTTGRYFIYEPYNHGIQVLDENFTHQMFVGEKGSGSSQLNVPRWSGSERRRSACCV